MSKLIAKLDVTVPDHPRLGVELSPELQASIQEALDALQEQGNGSSVQQIVADALQAAAEQRYFRTAEWQAAERAADEAVGEGRVRTFDSMEAMLAFLDTQ